MTSRIMPALLVPAVAAPAVADPPEPTGFDPIVHLAYVEKGKLVYTSSHGVPVERTVKTVVERDGRRMVVEEKVTVLEHVVEKSSIPLKGLNAKDMRGRPISRPG